MNTTYRVNYVRCLVCGCEMHPGGLANHNELHVRLGELERHVERLYNRGRSRITYTITAKGEKYRNLVQAGLATTRNHHNDKPIED